MKELDDSSPIEFEPVHNNDYELMQQEVIQDDHELHALDTLLFDIFSSQSNADDV